MIQGELKIKNATVEGVNGFITVEGVGNKLVLEDCKIEANNDAGRAINVLEGAEVTVGKGCEVTGNGCVVFVNTTGAKSVLNVAGKIACTDENYAIGGNGSAGNQAIEVNILEGAEVTSALDSAVFMPVAGVVNVKGGFIEGKDGIYQKSGVVNVAGGVIKGNGNAEYKYSGNGSNAMGHGIVCEFTNYPSGLAKLNVAGGEIVSVNKEAVGYVKSPKLTIPDTLEELVAANVVIGENAVLTNKQ